MDAIDQVLVGLIVRNKKKILCIECPAELGEFLKTGLFDESLKDSNMNSVLDPDFLENLLNDF